MRIAIGVLVLALIATGCANGDDSSGAAPGSTTSTASSGSPSRPVEYRYGDSPVVDDSPTPDASEAYSTIVGSLSATGSFTEAELDALVRAGDARHAWLTSDLLRFSADPGEVDRLVGAFVDLTTVDPSDDPTFSQSPWKSITDHLIAWDLSAPPDYQKLKASLFTIVEPGWAPFFADSDADIDWRLLSWGGVLIDDRPLGTPEGCTRGCIPALDDPTTTDAGGGDWYPDDAIVFGIVVGDDVVALPKNIMQIHEMVNMTIGGRRYGIPYCTLCGSAQAYITDEVPDGVEVPVLRTSGLLSRSNKVMYDLVTMSVFDTFTGAAVSGPLQDADVVLGQSTVVVTTWGEWKSAHPNTRIIAEDGGIGRSYDLDPLGGRDDNGPIFPTGDVDPRLPVQEPVVGVVTDTGDTVAFPAAAARANLAAGDEVVASGIELYADGGGLRARTADGIEVPTHEAFWFAWSQFHPGTALWAPQ
jgi:hypothetical protein